MHVPEVQSAECWNCQGRQLTHGCGVCKDTGITLTIPWHDEPWSEIAPNLWMGGHEIMGDSRQCIVGSEFDLVLSLHRKYGWGPDEGVETYGYWLHDELLEALDEKHHGPLDAMAQHGADAVLAGRKTLVRCQAGLNRSGLVTAMILMKMGLTADEAIAKVREGRGPTALFNEQFVNHLKTLEVSA